MVKAGNYFDEVQSKLEDCSKGIVDQQRQSLRARRRGYDTSQAIARFKDIQKVLRARAGRRVRVLNPDGGKT